MSKARLVITAVIVEGRTINEAARTYGVSRSWAHELVARYRTEGDTALEARSRRPKHSPRRISDETIELIRDQRRAVLAQGLDAGAHTIAWHLEHHHHMKVSADERYSLGHRLTIASGTDRTTGDRHQANRYVRACTQEVQQWRTRRWVRRLQHQQRGPGQKRRRHRHNLKSRSPMPTRSGRRVRDAPTTRRTP